MPAFRYLRRSMYQRPTKRAQHKAKKERIPIRTTIPTDNFFPPRLTVGVLVLPLVDPPLEIGWLRTLSVLNSSKAIVGFVRESNPNLGVIVWLLPFTREKEPSALG